MPSPRGIGPHMPVCVCVAPGPLRNGAVHPMCVWVWPLRSEGRDSLVHFNGQKNQYTCAVPSFPDRNTSRTALQFWRSLLRPLFFAPFLSRGPQLVRVCVGGGGGDVTAKVLADGERQCGKPKCRRWP